MNGGVKLERETYNLVTKTTTCVSRLQQIVQQHKLKKNK